MPQVDMLITPTPTPAPTPTPTPEPTPTPTPTPNALARGLLPTTQSPTLDNPCEAIPEPDIPECIDLPAETPESTPLPPSPEALLDFPTEEIEEIPNVPLEDTEVEEETEEESGGEGPKKSQVRRRVRWRRDRRRVRWRRRINR